MGGGGEEARSQSRAPNSASHMTHFQIRHRSLPPQGGVRRIVHLPLSSGSCGPLVEEAHWTGASTRHMENSDVWELHITEPRRAHGVNMSPGESGSETHCVPG